MKRDTWCRHRTPFTAEHKVCEAGVDFHQFESEPKFKGIRLMPCLGESAEAIARCPKYEPWTDEEIAAEEADPAFNASASSGAPSWST